MIHDYQEDGVPVATYLVLMFTYLEISFLGRYFDTRKRNEKEEGLKQQDFQAVL